MIKTVLFENKLFRIHLSKNHPNILEIDSIFYITETGGKEIYDFIGTDLEHMKPLLIQAYKEQRMLELLDKNKLWDDSYGLEKAK